MKLSNWKSFCRNGGIEVPLAKSTLLVGPNASGKSNVLDALRFLQGCAMDLPIDEVLRGHWEGGRQTWTGVRGGAAEAAWDKETRFGIELSCFAEEAEVVHNIEVVTDPEPHVFSERLALANAASYLFDTHANSLGAGKGVAPGGSINVAFTCTGGGRNDRTTVRAARSVLGQLEASTRMKPEVMTMTRAVKRLLRELFHLEIQPHLMRGPAPQHASRMSASGENVAAVLFQMPENQRQDLLDWLGELCAPRLTSIEFEEVAAVREVYFLLVEREKIRVSSRSLSDGTLRFLGILVALLTAPKGSTILLEEPDVGLHPARIHLLAEILEQIPKRRKIQVIATTHSPSLLAHASDDMLADVIAFDRDPESGGSFAVRVGDLPNFESLRSSRERDHLIATGWLERAL